MKGSLRLLFKLLLVLVAFFIVFWLGIVYPNDARIALFKSHEANNDDSSSGAKNSWLVRKRFFADRLPFRINVSEDEYRRAFKEIEPLLPAEAQLDSSRFYSSKQLYLPIGLYPYRLDGRDGIYLPPGARLFVNSGLVGSIKVQVGLWSMGSSATLELTSGKGKPALKLDYVPPKSQINADSVLFRTVGKWLQVDLDAGKNFPGWADGQGYFEISESDEVVFTCQTEGKGCFISEPSFLVQDGTFQKNFLVVLVDTLRRDAVDSHISPRMQNLAQNSVNFTNAIAPGNMTSPSTNALLSCRLPTELGGWAFAYGVSKNERNEIYRKSIKSFPDRFSQAGYLTAMIGSVSVISELYGVGIHHGFNRQIAIETDGFDTAQITREAQRWIGEHASDRFLLYVHLNAPHAPYKAPLRDVFSTWPGFSVFGSYADILRWLYAGEVHYTDRYLDHLLRTLDELNLSRHTVVTLVADHGDQMRTHYFSDNEAGPAFEGSYFDHGATLLEDEIGVPLIIHDPQLSNGKRVDDRVSTIDLGPTLMDIAGIGVNGACSGKSLVPYVHGVADKALTHRLLASEGFQGRAVIFDNRFKYIRSYEPTTKRIHRPNHYLSEETVYFSKEQLFDLKNDPMEERNLAPSDDTGLLNKARESYRRMFGVKEGWELVVESPDGAEISGQFAAGTKVHITHGEAVISSGNGRVQLQGKGQTTLILEIENWDPKASWLRIGDRAVDIKKTSLRLPVQSNIGALPIESGGQESLIPYPRGASAYIRRVEDAGREERKIRVTNPAFESVLREWGYLNDR